MEKDPPGLGTVSQAVFSVKGWIDLSWRVAAPVAFLLAITYHHGFWSAFDINILQFTSIPNLAKLALWPLFGVMVLLAIMSLIGHWTNRGPDNSTRYHAPPNPNRWQRLREWANAHGWAIVAYLNCASSIYHSFSRGSSYRWAMVLILIGGFIGAQIAKTQRLKQLIVDPLRRYTFCVAAGMAPLLAWGWGWGDAEEIRLGKQYFRVVLTPEVATRLGLASETDLRYLTDTGTVVILMVESKGLIVIATDSLGAFKLIRAGSGNEDQRH